MTRVLTLVLAVFLTSAPICLFGQDAGDAGRAAKIKERGKQSLAAQNAKDAGDFATAIKAAAEEATLELKRSLLGVDHPELISRLTFLAKCEEGRQNWEASKAIRTEVLTRSIKAYGEEDYRVADARRAITQVGILERLTADQREQLADADARNTRFIRFYREGNYAAAIKLAGETLSVREKILGPEHPDTATSLNNLAELYRVQANFADAGPLHQRALKIRETARSEGTRQNSSHRH